MIFQGIRPLLSVVLMLFAFHALAQNPMHWTFTSKAVGNGQYDLVMTGKLDEGFYTYSQQSAGDDGPLPTEIAFEEGPHFKLVGKAAESGGKVEAFDKVFGMTLHKFKHEAIFTQRVQVTDATKPIKGYIAAQCCNDNACFPPRPVDFSFVVTPTAAPAKTETPTPNTPAPAPNSTAPTDGGQGSTETLPTDPLTPAAADNEAASGLGVAPVPPDDANFMGFFNTKRDINSAQFVNNCSAEVKEEGSLAWVFVAGFLGGLLALLTPCVFPMIPLTVAFFTKRSPNRATGLRNALWYGASIVLIYVSIGIGVTMAFGASTLNEMSTDMYFNLLFFGIFIAFALSFFGLFEIQLPSSWVNSSDKMADRGGMLGIFFMAFTLALVSFSCTGPIVGTLLVETAKSNGGSEIFGFIPARPFVGLSGFGFALALPFALFAMFPGWLNSLPKSGGWMDNVKITLGFVELALALKFFSTADMVRHWELLKFEPFLAMWLIIAVLLAAYQFGLLKIKGNTGRPGLARLVIGVSAAAFAVYLGWGLFNYKSLSLLSGIAPPAHYNFFRPMDCPHGLDCYHDFDEGLAEAKRQNKPIFVDFTGYGCVNCRKMEENVWHRPGVYEHLKDNYVLISLYVDDQERIFPDNKFLYLLDPVTNEKIRTKGDKWGQFESSNFGKISQPWYVLMSNDGKTLLSPGRGFTPDVEEYKAFLDCGFEAFQRVKDGKSKEMLGATQKD